MVNTTPNHKLIQIATMSSGTDTVPSTASARIAKIEKVQAELKKLQEQVGGQLPTYGSKGDRKGFGLGFRKVKGKESVPRGKKTLRLSRNTIPCNRWILLFMIIGLTFVLGKFLLPKIVGGTCSQVHSTDRMQAVYYAESGPADALTTGSYVRPHPGPGQVLVKVHAAAMNPVDFKLRNHWLPNFLLPRPKVPGADIAGEVLDFTRPTRGPKRKEPLFAPGDRVFGMLPLLGCRFGAFAEYVAVDEALLAKIPASLSYEDAAALPLVTLTVLQAFAALGYDDLATDLRGKHILIHAGSGGVGTVAIQYAKHLGMHVTTTSTNSLLCTALGADAVVDYREVEFDSPGTRYDVVFDLIGGPIEERGLRILSGPDGHYISILNSGWERDGRSPRMALAKALSGWLHYKVLLPLDNRFGLSIVFYS
jgi:NADPH:quinone reductase-like Zn-dependent oxidoreductase